MVALDADSGKLRWHFQFTPHDAHDWDSVQIPILIDRTIDGTPRKLMAWANRNGFYYLLDRTNGKPLLGIDEKPVPQEPPVVDQDERQPDRIVGEDQDLAENDRILTFGTSVDGASL